MKCLFSILFTLFWVVSTAQNNLYIAGPDGQGVTSHEVLTGGSFQLDYVFSIPRDECKKVKVTIPFQSNILFNNQDVFVFYGPFNISYLNNAIIFEAIVSHGQSLKINGRLSNVGNICENQPLEYSINTQYFNADNTICENTRESNKISIIPKYNFTYSQSLQLQNNGTACKGGFLRYKVVFPLGVRQGNYILNNVSFVCETNSELNSILDQNGNLWPITNNISNQPNCLKSYEFNYKGLPNNSMNLLYNYEVFYLIFKSKCECSTGNQPLAVKLIAKGKDPCSHEVQFETQTSYIFNSECCNTSQNGTIGVGKYLEYTIEPFCSGGCHKYTYDIQYSNVNSSIPVNNLQITDPLPNGVKVSSVLNKRYLSNGQEIKYRMCYTTVQNTQEVCYIIGSQIPYDYWTPSDIVRTIRWEFIDPIPAWYSQNISYKIMFDIMPNITFLSDNIASFSSNSPSFSYQAKWIHGQVPICEPYYRLQQQTFIQNNQLLYNVNSFPSATEKFRVSLLNEGNGNSPKAFVKIKLPFGIAYSGNLVYGIMNANGFPVYQPIPSSLVVNYDQNLNELTISNIDISACNGFEPFIEFDLNVQSGLPAGVRKMAVITNNGQENWHDITINDYYKINAKIYQRCKSGDLITLENKVIASESLEYVYELENVGNESVNEIKIFNHKPKQNDFTLNSPNQVARNSEVSTNYSENIYELNNVPVQAQYINSISNNDICSASFGGPASSPENATMMVIKPQDPDYILGPGQKIQIVQKHTIDPGQPLNSICNNDFSFCLRRVQFTTPDNGISDQIRLTLSDTTLCPKVVGCDEVANIETRFEDAFNVQVSGNQVTLTAQNLSNNDQWSLVWDDEQYFANESHWGNQTVSRTFPNNVTGQHKLCIKIKNHLEANNSHSQECKCELICKTFNLN